MPPTLGYLGVLLHTPGSCCWDGGASCAHADRRPPRYLLSDLLELAGYEPGEASAVAITGMQTDPSQASDAQPAPAGRAAPAAPYS